MKTFEVTETRHKRPYIVQFPLYKMFRIGKYIESLGVEGAGRAKSDYYGYGVSFRDNENVLELDPGDGGTIL